MLQEAREEVVGSLSKLWKRNPYRSGGGGWHPKSRQTTPEGPGNLGLSRGSPPTNHSSILPTPRFRQLSSPCAPAGKHPLQQVRPPKLTRRHGQGPASP